MKAKAKLKQSSKSFKLPALKKTRPARLKLSQKDCQTTVQTSLDGFWVVDTEGNFLEVNQAYCSLTGYSRKELLAMRVQDIEVMENEAEVARHIKKMIKTSSDCFETRHRAKDGRIIDLEVSVNYSRSLRKRVYAIPGSQAPGR